MRSISMQAEYTTLYSEYCNQQANVADTLQRMRKRSSALDSFLEEMMKSPDCAGLPLTSFLIKPGTAMREHENASVYRRLTNAIMMASLVQRICKYPLLLRVREAILTAA